MHSLARDRQQITVTAEGAQRGKMAEIPPNRLFWRRAASLDAFYVGFGTERRSEREQLGRSAYLISLNQADLFPPIRNGKAAKSLDLRPFRRSLRADMGHLLY